MYFILFAARPCACPCPSVLVCVCWLPHMCHMGAPSRSHTVCVCVPILMDCLVKWHKKMLRKFMRTIKSRKFLNKANAMGGIEWDVRCQKMDWSELQMEWTKVKCEIGVFATRVSQFCADIKLIMHLPRRRFALSLMKAVCGRCYCRWCRCSTLLPRPSPLPPGFQRDALIEQLRQSGSSSSSSSGNALRSQQTLWHLSICTVNCWLTSGDAA